MGVQVSVHTLRNRWLIPPDEEQKSIQEAYLRRKEGEFLSVIKQALESSEEHAAILAWDA